MSKTSPRRGLAENESRLSRKRVEAKSSLSPNESETESRSRLKFRAKLMDMGHELLLGPCTYTGIYSKPYIQKLKSGT